MADSICLPETMARQTFYAHAKCLYKLMDEFVRENMVLVHKAVKAFILRKPQFEGTENYIFCNSNLVVAMPFRLDLSLSMTSAGHCRFLKLLWNNSQVYNKVTKKIFKNNHSPLPQFTV